MVRILKVEGGFIPDSLYDKIVKCMPIPSVEAIIVKDDRLLFLRRKNSPAKGQWWFPGGRIRRGNLLKKLCFERLRRKPCFL